MKNVEIKPKLNGWLVSVGCSDVLFTDKQTMLNELGRYIDSPKEVEEEYQENAKNKNTTSELRVGNLSIEYIN